jgi:hypothetical protein
MIALLAWRRNRPGLWLALYTVAALCVLSFIAFEVLDLDGSDFQPAKTPGRPSLSQSTSEEHADDLKRCVVVVTLPTALLVAVALLSAISGAGCRERRDVRTMVRPIRRLRPLLPRASLVDSPAPSA